MIAVIDAATSHGSAGEKTTAELLLLLLKDIYRQSLLSNHPVERRQHCLLMDSHSGDSFNVITGTPSRTLGGCATSVRNGSSATSSFEYC